MLFNYFNYYPTNVAYSEQSENDCREGFDFSISSSVMREKEENDNTLLFVLQHHALLQSGSRYARNTGRKIVNFPEELQTDLYKETNKTNTE